MDTIWTPKTLYLISLVCGYELLCHFAPIMPYYVPYVIQAKHIRIQQLTTQILPVTSYSIPLFMLLLTPACKAVSYRGVVIIGTFCALASQVFVLLASSLFWIQLTVAMSTFAYAKHMALSSYLFLLIDEEEYQLLTSCSKAASSISLFISSELGQLLVSQNAKFTSLIYIGLVMASLASIIAFFLPKDPPKSQVLEPLNQTNSPMSRSFRRCMLDLYKTYKETWRVTKQAWKSKGLQVLTFWWAFTMACFPLVASYGTSLFEAIDPVSTYNGHVIAATQAIGFIASLTAVPLSRKADHTGGLVYFLGTLLVGILSLVMSHTNILLVAQITYVISVGFIELLFCLLIVQCAKCISDGQYILVFSLNTVGGLIMQAVLQATIAFIGISVFTQYFIMGILLLAVGFAFAVICLIFYYETGSVVLVPIESQISTYGTFAALEDPE